MTQIFHSLIGNLMVPTILFFVLGLIAAAVRSDLSIPEGAAKFMSLYLLLAIGFKGGHSLAQHGSAPMSLPPLVPGWCCPFCCPLSPMRCCGA